MDERTLDGIARAAGLLRNKIEPGEAVVMAGLSDEDSRYVETAKPDSEMDCRPVRSIGVIGNLHDFACDVLEMVALLRKAKASVAAAQREYNEMLTGTFGVTTADVDLFAPPRSAEEQDDDEPLAAGAYPEDYAGTMPDGEYRQALERVDPEWFRKQKYARFGGLGEIDDSE